MRGEAFRFRVLCLAMVAPVLAACATRVSPVPVFAPLASSHVLVRADDPAIAQWLGETKIARPAPDESKADLEIVVRSRLDGGKKVSVVQTLGLNLLTFWTGYVFLRFRCSLQLALDADVRDATGSVLAHHGGQWASRRYNYGQDFPPDSGVFEGVFLEMKNDLTRQAALDLAAFLDANRSLLERRAIEAPSSGPAARAVAGKSLKEARLP